MSYEIKTIYRAVVPMFEGGGIAHQGWYWDEETALSMITDDGGSRQGGVHPYEVIVMGDGDILFAQSDLHGHKKTTIEKITVYSDSLEDRRAATLDRLPALWKKTLGLPYDEDKASKQRFALSREDAPYLRDKLLLLDVSAGEAEALGLTEDREQAIRNFEDMSRKQEEDEKQKRLDHPLIDQSIWMEVPSSHFSWNTWNEYVVRDLKEDGDDPVYHCHTKDFLAYGVKKEDEKRLWKRSEIEEAQKRYHEEKTP